MNLTNLAIKYRTSVVVLTVLLVIGGLFAYVTLPKESNPSIELPTIVVTTIYPGASPDDVESVVTQIIEQEIESVSDIDVLSSTSTEGVSTIIVEFTPDVEVTEALQRVRDKVDLAKPDLPSDVEDPLISEIDLSEMPILTVNLSADYSLARLTDVAEELQDELEGITSVLGVDLIGGLEREVQVDVDLGALQGYNLTFNDLITTIQAENTNLPGGSIDVDALNYLVRVDGEFEDPENIRDLVIDAPGGTPVYVRDVADVRFGFIERESYSRLRVLQVENEEDELVQVGDATTDMLPVISLNVKKRSGDNILETAEAVQEVLAGVTLPTGTQVTLTGDQSENVESLVKDLENNIISGLIFVVAVLLFFLGVRNATLVGIAIPLSMCVSFLVFSVMGQTLNFIILFSLIIALGMLVDNAVVIVENIYRYREEGHDRWEAAKLGTQEVGGAVIASTATTLAAFAPMLLWPGVIGEFMGYMPLTLIVTLTSSLFVALLINPVITGFFVRLPGEGSDKGRMKRPARFVLTGVIVFVAVILAVSNWETLVVLAVGMPVLYLLHTRVFAPIGDHFVEHDLPALTRWYRSFLTNMLQRDYDVRHAHLRNMGALAAFTLGFVLLIVGAMLGSVGGPLLLGMPVPQAIVMVAAGVALALGVLGIVVHAVEALVLGGWGSLMAGIGLLVVFALIAGLGVLADRMDLLTAMKLLALPLFIVVFVALGVLLQTMGVLRRKRLLLTDNRAMLLNGTLAMLLAVIALFMVAPTGVAFFPETDPNQVRVTLNAPLGTNIEASNEVAAEAQERLTELMAQHPEAEANVKNELVNVGVGGDASFGGGAASPERSRLTLNLVDYADRAEPSTVTLQRIRDELRGLPGIDIEIAKDQSGPPTGAPVNIEVTGPQFDQLVEIAGDVRSLLEEASETGTIPGLVDIGDNLNTGRPELSVDIDRERAARFGLSTQQIASTVRAAINGIEASQYRDGEDEYDIRVRLREEDRQSLESVRNLTILSEGQQIPLVAVADLRVGSGLGSITRQDLERVVTITGEAAPGANANAILGQVQGYLAEYQQSLPAGYTMSYTGQNEEQQESFGFLTTALLIGIALITMILIAQFNNVSAPFIIMVAVGLGLIGVLLGLIVTRTPFSLFTFIGLISLAGIIVNNNIVLVDYIMQLRERGMGKQEAIIEGGVTRLRPVLLTALTTILGLVPLTFGINIDFVGLLTDLEPDFQIGSENTQFWGPMGTAIISGLTFGTFLTLVIVPVMYSAFDSLGQWASGTFGRDAAPETPIVSDERPGTQGEELHLGGDGAPLQPAPAQQT